MPLLHRCCPSFTVPSAHLHVGAAQSPLESQCAPFGPCVTLPLYGSHAPEADDVVLVPEPLDELHAAASRVDAKSHVASFLFPPILRI